MPYQTAKPLLRLLLVACLATVLPAVTPDGRFIGAAWADDGDGDGDGGDGDGDGDDGDSDSDGDSSDGDDDGRSDGGRAAPGIGGGEGFLNRLFRPAPQPQPQPIRPRPVAQTLPDRATNEIVVLDLSQQDLATLVARGYTVVESAPISLTGSRVERLEVPSGTSLVDALAEIQALPSGQSADFNHYYRAGQGEPAACEGLHCAAFELVDWNPSAVPATLCGRPSARIGLIDTGINPDHEAFADGRLSMLPLGPGARETSGRQHGTAVAAILIGSRAGRAQGLLPDAELIAIDAFYRAGRDERSDVFRLVQAMDLLAAEDVAVINMSLAGPPNVLLERMVLALRDERILIVSAAGNDGPRADPVFPGGYTPVLTVTAVDGLGRAYRRAGRGPHIDLAAPGVDVWTAASIRGVRSKTGTSFATPFATAAAALLITAEPDLTVAEIKAALRARALDLGDAGPDETYGAGLVQFADLCTGRHDSQPVLSD